MIWTSASSFERVRLIHCWAVLDLKAGIEQPFHYLVDQNRQAMHSMRMPIDWPVKDKMFNGLFLCTTLTSRKRGHIPFVEAGAETSDTGAEAVKPDPRCSWVPMSRMKVCSLVMTPHFHPRHRHSASPTSSHSVFHRWSAHSAVLLFWLADTQRVVVRRIQMGVSIWDAVCSYPVNSWEMSTAQVQAP